MNKIFIGNFRVLQNMIKIREVNKKYTAQVRSTKIVNNNSCILQLQEFTK